MGEASNPHVHGKVAVTVIGLPASGLASIFASKVFDRWGVLDAPADAVGDALKASVSGADLALFMGLVLFLALYGALLWLVWRRDRGSHSAGIDTTTAPSSPQPLEIAPVFEREAQGRRWKSLLLDFKTDNVVDDAIAELSSLQRFENQRWKAVGARFACRLGWPGNIDEHFVPKRICEGDKVLLLDYEEATRRLFFHSNAQYTGFVGMSFGPPKDLKIKGGIPHGTYRFIVTVLGASGVHAKRAFQLNWNGDFESLALMPFGANGEPYE